MTTQPDLFTAEQTATLPAGVTSDDQAAFRTHLTTHGWQTRKEICAALGWDERKVRDVAESLGSEVVRCQFGFKLTANITREDLSAVKQAIDAFLSQSRKMADYAQSLRRRLHSIIQ